MVFHNDYANAVGAHKVYRHGIVDMVVGHFCSMRGISVAVLRSQNLKLHLSENKLKRKIYSRHKCSNLSSPPGYTNIRQYRYDTTNKAHNLRLHCVTMKMPSPAAEDFS